MRSGKSIEILIAEDSPTQAIRLQALLEEHGYTVMVTTNGKEALALAREHKPTLLISDILMPELDGYGLCHAIKSDAELSDTPVILTTTLSDPQDVIRGLECGADNFIRKPYEESYLLSRIGYLLMNFDLRKNQTVQMGMEVRLGNHRHFITAERQQILDLLISMYEQAILVNNELKQREKELEYSNQTIQGLYQVADILNRAVSEQEVAELALERTVELPGVRAGWIYLHEGHSGFRLVATRNVPPALREPGALEGSCLCRRKLLSAELDGPVNILECERLGKGNGDLQGLRYHASVPLRVADRMLGIINVAAPGEGRFNEKELEVLHSVGNQVAVALERAKLHEHLERLVDQRTAALTAEIERRKEQEAHVARLNRIYSVLSGINATIVRVREGQDLFETTCRIAVDQGGFRFAWIGVLDADAQDITPVAQAGHDEGYLPQVIVTTGKDSPAYCPLIADALTQGKPVICNDVATGEHMEGWRDEALMRGYQSAAFFPLIVEEKPVAVLVLYAPERDVFDDEEMRLLEEMAGDISFALDHLKKEEHLNYLAYYDAVSGLPNRTLFLDRLDQRLNGATRDLQIFSAIVIVIDIDRFSRINETFGRQMGDDLLRQVAQRLQENVNETCLVARFSGDEFGIATPSAEDAAHLGRMLEQILSCIQDPPFVIGGQELRLSAKAGVSSFPHDGQDPETLLRNAEAALKKAKVSGDKYLFYAPEFNARVAEKLTLENKLRRALEQEHLVLHYQPQVNLTTGRISGLEALMRWNDPDIGLVPPLQFIPLLEETGLILEAGRWALMKAASDSRAWQMKGLQPPKVAINVSPIQLFHKDFVNTVERVVRGANEAVGRLELEITESLIMRDIGTNIQKLQAIREMGVEVAIDDFGTGYSSLSYLTLLPISTVKIDRAFIMNMTSNSNDLSIVSTIISLAHSLDLKVVAEGVETAEQAKLLRLLKCDEIQGFLFSQAVPAEQIELFLRENKSLEV